MFSGTEGGSNLPINKNELTKEMIEKALPCNTADELIVLVKTAGFLNWR
jgi:hypothetical protein